jgi:hypothetical protein
MSTNLKNIEYYFEYDNFFILDENINNMSVVEIINYMVKKTIKKIKIKQKYGDKVFMIEENKQKKLVYEDFLFSDFEIAKAVFVYIFKNEFEKYKFKKDNEYYIIMNSECEILVYDKYIELQNYLNMIFQEYLTQYPEIILKYQKYIEE